MIEWRLQNCLSVDPIHSFFTIPLEPYCFPHFATFVSISHLTKTITTSTIHPSKVSVSPFQNPPRTLPPITLVMTSLIMVLVGISSSPFSNPRIARCAQSSGFKIWSPSSSDFVTSVFSRFSSSNDCVGIVAGKTVCTRTRGRSGCAAAYKFISCESESESALMAALFVCLFVVINVL